MVYYVNIEAFESNKANVINKYLSLTYFTAAIMQCAGSI
jgi:hypothetical protein